MAAIVHFFHISPQEYWECDYDEVEALVRYRDKYIQMMEQQK
jgi:hypothetical protein